MSIGPIVTLGFGSFGSANLIPTMGFSSLAAGELPLKFCLAGQVRLKNDLSGQVSNKENLSGITVQKISLNLKILACTD